MRTPRQQFIDRAIVRHLAEAKGGTLQESQLVEHLRLSVSPQATRSELDDSLTHHDDAYRIASVDTTYGRYWTLTAMGSAWKVAQRV